jgi:GNAT superfamily N-acetyltransferase
VKIDRNTFVDGSWVLKKIENRTICDAFDCGDTDLNEYFHVDAILHKQELLTETYCFQEITFPDLAVAILDFCNDAVQFQKLHGAVDIPRQKQYSSLPAVKLTRFGVAKEFQGKSIGSHIINMMKILFTTDNRTGCRFITVDAYNTPNVIKFYEKNGFKLFTEKDKDKGTRALFFDLKRFQIT